MALLANPDAGFLEMLGGTREEQVETMATMLRNSSEADVEEMGTVFGLALAKVAEQGAGGPTEQDRSKPDPIAMLANGMKRIAGLDLDDIRGGLENLSRPSVGGLLRMLGRTREERVEKMASMLRSASPADMEEMATVYAQAMTTATDGAERPAAEKRRKRRDQTAAEWRKERRLAL